MGRHYRLPTGGLDVYFRSLGCSGQVKGAGAAGASDGVQDGERKWYISN